MTRHPPAAQESYDRVLYPGEPFAQTHPDRLATIATLFGMHPAPVERCRVLEIGCTDGGNLIPIAYGLPGAECVGIDVSKRSISAGQACIEELELKNISLRELDLLDLPKDFGVFDYIIAHGIFSWVPLAVRQKILAVCRAHLAPHGVAYISYNTYPGAHFRELVRGMMLYHTSDIRDPGEKRRQATALLRFVAESQPDEGLFGKVLGAELQKIEERGDAAVYHDDLADVRSAFYFHEFVAQAADHGLQYLAEASLPDMQAGAFPPPALEMLNGLASDRVRREQYLDFLTCRRFRQTLLCHGEAALDGPRPEAVRGFRIASAAKPCSANPQLALSIPEEFEAPGNARLKTADSLAKAIVLHLGGIWPQSIPFPDLLAAGRARLGLPADPGADEETASEYAEALLGMAMAGVVELHLHAPHMAIEPSAQPTISPLVRWRLMQKAGTATNLLHRPVRVEDPIVRELMLLLDGTRDRRALAHDLAEFCRRMPTSPQAGATNLTDPAQLRKTIAASLDQKLAQLARMAVLVA